MPESQDGFDLTYLSLGAGVESSAMLFMSGLGLQDCPRADFAIFADTHAEPHWVYEHLERLKTSSPIPIQVVSAGDLMQDVIDRHSGKRRRFAAIPAWVNGGNGRAVPLRRQCTREYKIDPIERHVRLYLGYSPRRRIRAQVRCLIGISSSEKITRLRPSRTPWITNDFPLAWAGLTRRDCMRIYRKLSGHDVRPLKSSCVCCPYHSDEYWQDLKANFPEEFNRAVEFDCAIRDMSKSGIKKPAYLHRSCKPLTEVDFTGGGQKHFDFFDAECDGLCGL